MMPWLRKEIVRMNRIATESFMKTYWDEFRRVVVKPYGVQLIMVPDIKRK